MGHANPSTATGTATGTATDADPDTHPDAEDGAELELLGSAWTADVGRALHMTGFGRRVGRLYEAGCTGDEGWRFSYLAATAEAAFAGLTRIAHR